MYLIHNGEIYDYDLVLFEETANFLDDQIVSLRESSPDNFDQFDLDISIDNVLSLGFIACQFYMTTTIAESHLKKPVALKLGPIHQCGIPYACLLHAAANCCKHYEEWPKDLNSKGRHRDTLDVLDKLLETVGLDFSPTIILEQIMECDMPSIASIVPILASWRDSLRSDT